MNQSDRASYTLQKLIATAMLCVLCQPTTEAQTATTQTLRPASSRLRPAADLLKEGFDHIKALQADKAILCFAPLVAHAARQDWSKPGQRKLLARYYCLVGRTLALDDNSAAASQAFYIATRLAPDDQSAALFLMPNWLRCGKDKDAQTLLQLAIRKAPADRLAARQAALCLLREEQVAQAASILKEGMRLQGAEADWRMHNLLGHAFMKQGYTKLATIELETAAKSADAYTANLIKATAYALNRKKEQQEASLRAAGKVLPDDPLWQANLAGLLSANSSPQALSWYESALKERRLILKCYLWYGEYQSAQKNQEEAWRCLRHLELVAPGREQTLLLRGDLLAREQKFDEAALCYEQLCKQHPHLGSGYLILAQFMTEHKMADRALPWLKRCVANLPDFPGGWRRLGDLYLARSQWPEAGQCYATALALLPADTAHLNELALHERANAHAGMAVSAYKTGDTNTALAQAQYYNRFKFIAPLPWYLKMVHLSPDRIDMLSMTEKERKCQAHVLLADALRQRHQLADSIKEFRSAIAINPDDVTLHTYLLDTLTEANDWVGAAREDLEASNKMVAKAPEAMRKLFHDDGANRQTDEEAKQQPNHQDGTAPIR